MDDIAAFNKERWEALVKAGVAYSRPFLDIDEAKARRFVDRYGFLGDVTDKEVLCLAAGGGQQSVAFSYLGAHATVLDLTEGQLEKDKLAAKHHGYKVRTLQGDMRDLSAFAEDSFDIVYHAFSLSFIPDAKPCFEEVARVLREGGIYRTHWTNPFLAGMEEGSWTGEHYLFPAQAYKDGAEIAFPDDAWLFEQEDGTEARVKGPKEYRHTLSGVINTLVGLGFVIRHLIEDPKKDETAERGSWEHLCTVAPPWLEVWTSYQPEFMASL